MGEAPALVEKSAPDEMEDAEDAEAMEDDRPAWPENGYKVAENKSVCCGGRIMESGEAIEPKHISNDEDVAYAMLDELLSSGHVVEA